MFVFRKRGKIPVSCLAVFSLLFLALFTVACSMPPEQVVHYDYMAVTVQDGDTLWDLANHWNPGQDASALVVMTMSYNRLVNSCIQPGQIVYIPIKAAY